MSKRRSIALVGATGSMGRQIEAIAGDHGVEIAARYDHDTPLREDTINGEVDAAIDFTRPEAVLRNVRTLAEAGVPIVLGTTGWEEEQEEVFSLVEENGGRLIWASNFSVGVQTFARIIRSAARLIDHLEQYDVALHEDHHIRKVDSPSGTALTLGDVLLEEIDRKERIVTERIDGAIAPEELHVSSRRVGETIGTHTITIDGAADTIELTHRARNRSGFASGALLAVDWICRQEGGVYRFDDVFEEIITSDK